MIAPLVHSIRLAAQSAGAAHGILAAVDHYQEMPTQKIYTEALAARERLTTALENVEEIIRLSRPVHDPLVAVP